MDNLSLPSMTFAMSKVALGAGTTTTLSLAGSPAGVTVYAIKSKVYSTAAGATIATPTVDSLTGAAFVPLVKNQGCIFVIGYDAAGGASNLRAVQGPIVALDATGAFIYDPQFPVIPDTICPVGYIVAKGGSALVSTWTFGTNNNSSVTGMTWSFVDISGLPDRPQAS